MLSRHIQRLGRVWVARWDLAERLFQNGQSYKHMTWAEYCCWTHYSRFNSQDCPGSCRHPLFWNWQLSKLLQNCSIHRCTPTMKSEGDEPSLKRRRHSEDPDGKLSISPNQISPPPSETQHERGSTPPTKGNTAFFFDFFILAGLWFPRI